MASDATYTVGNYSFVVTTGAHPFGYDTPYEARIVIDAKTPIDDPQWQEACSDLQAELPLLRFCQDLPKLAIYRDDREWLARSYQEHKAEADELAKSYDVPQWVWDELASWADELLSPLPPKKKTTLKPSPGYVYILQSDTGPYKIGRSNNPKSRIKTFGVQLPFEVEYLAVIPSDDYVGLETELHVQYEDKRVNGEWFDLSPEDVAHIQGLVS